MFFFHVPIDTIPDRSGATAHSYSMTFKVSYHQNPMEAVHVIIRGHRLMGIYNGNILLCLRNYRLSRDEYYIISFQYSISRYIYLVSRYNYLVSRDNIHETEIIWHLEVPDIRFRMVDIRFRYTGKIDRIHLSTIEVFSGKHQQICCFMNLYQEWKYNLVLKQTTNHDTCIMISWAAPMITAHKLDKHSRTKACDKTNRLP